MQITPVQHIGHYWFKRDDLFMPFDFSPANGSKLRQGMLLCEKNMIQVKKGIYTGTSIHSPQAVICASLARYYNVPCVIVYGGTNEAALLYNRYAQLCARLGARIEVCKSGRTSVVSSHAERFAQETNGFNVRYGFDLRNNADVFIGSVAEQAQNIPDNLDYLVITVGSAITITGVLFGLTIYNKHVRNVIAVGCAPNRMQKIQEYACIIKEQTGYTLPLELVSYQDCYARLKGYKYEDTQRAEYFGMTFHPRYEAKTFNFMQRYLSKDARTLMWITGHEL